MKNKMKAGFMATLMGAGLFFTACTNNDSIAPTEGTVADGDITIAEGTDPKNPQLDVEKTIYVSSMPSTQTEIQALITVTSTSSNMTRVYITENIAGAGEHPYVFPTKVDTKPDGSLDIPSSNGKNYQFMMTIPRLTNLTAGSVVYKIWATDGTGDYRDTNNSLRAGIGTLTINYGGANPDAPIKAFSAKILASPAQDGSSTTFISLIDGQLFKINQGTEYAKLWDFGYYYGLNDKASLAAADNYPSTIVDVPAVSGTPNSELNSCFFKKNNAANFDGATLADLGSIVKSNTESVTGLATGDIVEFVDNYGKTGLIRVVEIKAGYSPNTDYIKIDVKMQP